MTENPKMLPRPEGESDSDWLMPVLVFFGLFVVILLLLIGSGEPALSVAEKDDTATESTAATDAEISVQFVTPEDGDVVGESFTVEIDVEGATVEPSGTVNEGAGHLHILVDEPFVDAGEVIPTDDTHIHLGDGSMTHEITLAPGEYTLRLQFADGAHTALAGDEYRDEITIVVE